MSPAERAQVSAFSALATSAAVSVSVTAPSMAGWKSIRTSAVRSASYGESMLTLGSVIGEHRGAALAEGAQRFGMVLGRLDDREM